jgi:hypothetical protein
MKRIADSNSCYRGKKSAEEAADAVNRQMIACGFAARYEAVQKPNGWWQIVKVAA